MRIGIDAHYVGVRHGGNEQHFEQLIAHLLQLPTDGDEYFVFNYRGAARTRLPGTGFQLVPLRARSVFLQRGVELPLHSRRLRLDVLHVPFNFLPVFRCRKVVTIHDLGFLHFPDTYRSIERLRLVTLTRLAARWADWILTGSEFNRQELIQHYHVPPDRIAVTPSAVDRVTFRPLDPEGRAAARRRLGLERDYFLCVGTLQPRKNVPVVIDAMHRLPAGRMRECDLVLAGRLDWKGQSLLRLVADRGLDARVRYFGAVDAETLVALYNGALGLVLPSLYEGFGLPILEAMSCGCPVVSSTAAALPEVYGDAALTFDARSPDELCARLEQLAEDSALRADLVRRGLANCDRFSWHRTAQIAHRVYHGA